MATKKLTSGSQLPEITLSLVGGGKATLGKPQKEGNWQLVFVYRGLHCPICQKYLKKLESLKDKFLATAAEVVAVSGDPEGKAVAMVESAGLTFPVALRALHRTDAGSGALYLSSTVSGGNGSAFF